MPRWLVHPECLGHPSPSSVSTGFSAFNPASVVFGSAAAPLVTAGVAEQFNSNYRVAFLIVMPVAFIGSACLLLARSHIERDSAKVLEAVATAMAANAALERAYAAEESAAAREQSDTSVNGGGDQARPSAPDG